MSWQGCAPKKKLVSKHFLLASQLAVLFPILGFLEAKRLQGYLKTGEVSASCVHGAVFVRDPDLIRFLL